MRIFRCIVMIQEVASSFLLLEQVIEWNKMRERRVEKKNSWIMTMKKKLKWWKKILFIFSLPFHSLLTSTTARKIIMKWIIREWMWLCKSSLAPFSPLILFLTDSLYHIIFLFIKFNSFFPHFFRIRMKNFTVISFHSLLFMYSLFFFLLFNRLNWNFFSITVSSYSPWTIYSFLLFFM